MLETCSSLVVPNDNAKTWIIKRRGLEGGIEVADLTSFQEGRCGSQSSYIEQDCSWCLAPPVCSQCPYLSLPCCNTVSTPAPGYRLLAAWTSHPPEVGGSQSPLVYKAAGYILKDVAHLVECTR